MGSLTGFHPLIVSVWGSDIFEFPNKSYLYKKVIKYILAKADKIFSTSGSMAEEIQKYTNKKISITPFGVNTDIFKPMETQSFFEKEDIVIGTVKNLLPVYGIDRLIESFRIIKYKLPESKIKLLIVGGGPQENELKALAKKFNLENDIIFTGRKENKEIPYYYNMMKLAVFLSKSESFGVAALEASACEIPVLASDVSGFRETVKDKQSGIIINVDDLNFVADEIIKLLENKTQLIEMGRFGRKWVQDNFEEGKMINNLISLYESALGKNV